MSMYRTVSYVLRDRPDFGLMPGFCILGLRKPCQHEMKGPPPKHSLKTWPEFYRAILDGNKTFELRRDDRTPRFEAGDLIELVYYEPPAPEPPTPPKEK